jgi:hypothetical protein
MKKEYSAVALFAESGCLSFAVGLVYDLALARL